MSASRGLRAVQGVFEATEQKAKIIAKVYQIPVSKIKVSIQLRMTAFRGLPPELWAKNFRFRSLLPQK